MTDTRAAAGAARRSLAGMLVTALAGLWLCGAALAADEPLRWESLSAEQQRVLARLEDRWETFDAPRREALARGAERWRTMTPEQRQRARQRFARWSQLPDERRERLAR
jgi:hypothetical protein